MSNAIVIDNSEWAQYTDRYEKLMWTVARNISGDRAIADLETNYADLCVAAIDSIRCGKVPKDYLDRVCKNPDTIKDCMEILDNCFDDDNIEA